MGLHRDNGKEHGNYKGLWGIYRDNGQENGNYRDYTGYIGLFWGYIRIMEKKMETTGIIGVI